MKPRFVNQRIRALTLIEMLVVILVLFVIASMTLPVLQAARRRANSIGCENNLKQIAWGFRGWSNEHDGKFPMQVSQAEGGTEEPAASGNVAATFQGLSNQLTNPKILICPADKSKRVAANFSAGLNGSNLSYFIGVDAATNYPRAFLSGDDDFSSNGVPVKSGLWKFSTNGLSDLWSWPKAPIGYLDSRHMGDGNIAFVDGSVEPILDVYFVYHLSETGFTTNRLAIP